MIDLNIKEYEEILRKNYYYNKDSETMWDNRAEQYNISQLKDDDSITEQVLAYLEKKNILKNADIIDICGGSGRYAIPLAKLANTVTLTDISNNMLKFAEENAKMENLTNLEFIKTKWDEVDLEKMNWNKKFDLAYASMCPPVRTPEGLNNLIKASKKYCVVNQFIESKDSVEEYLKAKIPKVNRYDPHNDRESVQAIFNILWLKGYSPEISYVEEEREKNITREKAYERYSRKYEKLFEENKLDLRKTLGELSKDNLVSIKTKTKMAIIFWDIRK